MPPFSSATSEVSRRRLAAPALLSAVAAAVLAGCATEPAAPGAAATPTAAAAPAAPAATPAPRLAAPSNAIANAVRQAPAPAGAASGAAAGAPRPPVPGAPPVFTEVIKEAKSTAGYLTVWTKDEKTWLEIPADLLDKPLFFSTSLVGGLADAFQYPGLIGGEQVVVFRRVGNSVQMVARNLMARAPAGTPLARALEESYSDSLLAAAPLAAAPHVEKKSLLVDANALLGGDISGTQTRLEFAFRMPYALDRGNSSITRTRTTAEGTTVTFRSHFAVPKMPVPPVFLPGGPPPNPAMMPNPPSVVPDARSFFLSTSYSFRALPAEPMKPRLADQRVGFFTDPFFDFSDDAGGDRRTHQITRWRLEKKDPAAALSEPKDPIRVVMDRNIPEKWRAPVKAGILEWNKAFERAGFQNAVVVEQQPADADWATTDGERLLAVRWFAIDGPGATAVGPSLGDPRTGEILRGAAIIPENWVRFFRNNASDTTPRFNAAEAAQAAQAATSGALPGEFARRFQQCNYGQEALEQAQFGFELLSSRGAFDPQGPDAERYIADSLKDVTMHEVGHALGLRHNFRASTGVTRAQLRDPAFTAKNGVSNSVMDYNALNLPLNGEPVADYHMPTLGAYDLWAIEYGYKQFPPGTDAATEKAELAKLAAQSATDTRLAYATDEDIFGIDPRVNQRDLGDNPQAFAQRQLKLARELWTRTQQRELAADDDFTIYRRNLQRGLNSFASSVPMLAKYVGGTYTSRALAGAKQPLLVPVPAAEQRTALDVVLNEVFASQSFKFDPVFMSRLGVDQLGVRFRQPNVDFSLGNAVLGIQRGALDNLMGDTLAAKLADAETKVANPKELLSYAEVQQRISQAVWAELKGQKSGDIDSLRRNLQREHLRRVAAGVLRSASMAAADVRAVHRQVGLQLEAQLKAALASPAWNATAKAHLADSLATLSEALKAPLVKQGV